MADLKQVADLITALRGLMAFVLVWTGIALGQDGLGLVVLIMVGCWAGDFLDGRLARKGKTSRQTWIGEHDLQVDLFVSLGLGGYLLWSGYAGKAISLGYILIWCLIIWWKGPDRNLLMLFQAPIYFYFTLLSIHEVPEMGRLILVLILLILLINWNRFQHEIVPGFVAGFLDLWKHKST